MGQADKIADQVSDILSAKKQRNLLIIILILILVGIGFGFTRYQAMSTKLDISEQNQKALTDSLRLSKDKLGTVVASKNVLVAEKKDLANLNSELSEELKRMKGKVREISVVKTDIIHDTLYIQNELVKYDNDVHGLKWEHDTAYDESNKRFISGVSMFKLDSVTGKLEPLNTIISEDLIKFKMVTGLVEKDGNVEIFVKSDYPGFEVMELDGAIVDPKKHPVIKKFTNKKKWGIGPYVGVGFNGELKGVLQLGVGVQYSLIRF
jgi:hypothetical protein